MIRSPLHHPLMNYQSLQQSDFLLYKSSDGYVRVSVFMQNETVWLTQDQMAALFDKSKSTINEHIGNIYAEGELREADTMRKFGNSELSTKPTNYYNLDAIISVGYRVKSQRGTQFFATVQNKMHYAVHGHTAAEIIHKRADSSKPMMGLMSFNGRYITAGDVRVAKNYLSEKELKQLNLIVSLYLDFAELQASNERPMTMSDWVKKLD